MKMITRVLKVTAIVAASAAILAAQTPGFATNFTDDFNRPDSSSIDNGWSISANGNGGYGGGTAPTAKISGGQMVMDRAGWGPDAYIDVQRAVDSALSVQVDLSYVSEANGANADLQAAGAGGAFIMVRAFQSSEGKTVSVAVSPDGGWHDWATYGNVIDCAGPATYKLTAAGNSVLVDVLSGDSVLWSRSFDLALSSFDSASVKASWNGWTTGGTIYADNFAATSAAVPEPSSLLALAGALPLAILRRRSK